MDIKIDRDITSKKLIAVKGVLFLLLGIFSGMSSGGATVAALRLCEQLEEGVVVSIICDRGDRYLSSDLFD